MFNFANFPPQYSIVNYFQVMKHEEKLELTDYMQVNGFELISICGLGNEVLFLGDSKFGFSRIGPGFFPISGYTWFKFGSFWRGLNGFDSNDIIIQSG